MASEIRNRFTDTEMQIARETDLPELLSHLGYQVKRVGRFHTTAEMDSLRIKDRRTWFRYSQNTGGDAITFLQQFCGKSFPEAVEYLLIFHGKARDAPIPQPKPISPKQEFSLPPRNADDRRVFAYLRKRGIAAQVIRQFMNSGLLYQLLCCQAKECRLTKRAYLARLIEGRLVKARPTKEIKELRTEIHHIGNNINQIARSVNAGIAKPEDAKRGLYLLDQVYELMFRIANK